MKSRVSDLDMLHGPIAGKLVRFALPLAATGILQQLFNAMDVAVLGRFVGTNAMAAVGANTTIVSLVVSLFTGLALGTNVLIATAIGRNDAQSVNRGVHTSILVGLVGGVFLALAGQFLARPILALTSVPSELMDMAALYLRIYLAGMPVILLYNFESAIFRSVGNTLTPLYSLLISGGLNVLLNLFFVLVLHWSVDGVALATVLSNAVSALYLLRKLTKTELAIRVERRSLRCDATALKKIVTVGVPAGIQSMMFGLSNVVIQSAVNALGASVMAASVAAYNLEVNAFYVINAFGQAATTFIGQNAGAGNFQRCRQIARVDWLTASLFALGAMAVLLLFARPLLALFNDDPAVVQFGIVRMEYVLYPYLLNVMMEVFSGCMRGYGESFVPAAISVLGICGVRILWVWLAFPSNQTFDWLLTCYPLSWVVDALALAIAYLCVVHSVIKRGHTTRPASAVVAG